MTGNSQSQDLRRSAASLVTAVDSQLARVQEHLESLGQTSMLTATTAGSGEFLGDQAGDIMQGYHSVAGGMDQVKLSCSRQSVDLRSRGILSMDGAPSSMESRTLHSMLQSLEVRGPSTRRISTIILLCAPVGRGPCGLRCASLPWHRGEAVRYERRLVPLSKHKSDTQGLA